MTNNLINIILATCLLFSSLNLAAGQISTSSHKAEAQFLAGEACLKQANTACAMVALAKIPSSSPYAKLLQGEIAFHNQALDQALQLLLPLQSETQFTTEAKTSLHQYLANAFAQLQDTEQTLVHLLQVDIALSKTQASQQTNATALNHAKIWDLLNKLNQNELLAIRGNNTDDHFQGWVDLALAAKHQDLNNSLKTWKISYQDHPAVAFSSTLQTHNAAQTLKLQSDNVIAITYKTASDANSARAEAFKLGLQTALSHHGLNNPIYISASTNDKPDNHEQNLSVTETEAESPLVNPYLIALQFDQNTDEAESIRHQSTIHQTLTLGFDLNDEAEKIVKFASNNVISRVAILTTEDESSVALLNHFSAAWQKAFNLNEDHNTLNIITLPQHISASDPSLLDIQTKISTNPHDMVLLALSATDARTIKPYMNAGTPTVAFSNLHEISPDHQLNTVRFVEIPFLLPSNVELSAHQNAATQLKSNDLLRWYALGVDALPILIATQQSNEKEVIINGLTGKISVSRGMMTRELSMARFTYEGITNEQ
ncbi:MAG: penicillin-binding protein activator [Methylotenera sp.]|uniref:penicillin-binding protein activator n=1 Tax=Methylotenera sp. TaxID=2051956 RepID=UPI0027194E82|nr:penicillin-binding protein activator [Methylotenera sp.]MDO9151593.1 penicillin-binding protein activator [Methylotenera sp.]